MKRGRPPKIETNNFDINDLKAYIQENQKEHIPLETETSETETQTEPQTETNNYTYETDYEEIKDEQTQTQSNDDDADNNLADDGNNSDDDELPINELIKIDGKTLQMADVVISGILENSLNFIGIKKEIPLMTKDEARFFEKNIPPIKLQKNWKNIIMLYIFTKLK